MNSEDETRSGPRGTVKRGTVKAVVPELATQSTTQPERTRQPDPTLGATAAVTADASELSRRFVGETGLAHQLGQVIEPVLEGLGFRLVRIQVSGREGQTIQIMAERPDGTLTIDECATISRDVSAVLDVNDPVSGAYRLEVSSPGIDRPLVRPVDFEAWAGHEVKISLSELVSGRKRFKGVIEGFSEGEARIVCDLGEELGTQTLGLPLRLITEAKLVLTDDLIREALSRSKRERAK